MFKGILYSLMALMMTAAMMLPAASSALADSEEPTKSQLQSAATLIIKAPDNTELSQPLTISVFSKRGHETIAGASVYTLKASDLAVKADSENYTALMSEFTVTAESKGVLIGTTGTDGTVTGTLTETGRFILVAIKEGYIPGFTRISITQAVKKVLNIKVPGSVEINKSVTISATERFTQEPLTGVAVYARLLSDNDTLHVGAAPVEPQVHAIAQVRAREPLRKEAGLLGTTKVTKLESAISFHGEAEKPKPLFTVDNVTIIRSDPWDETTADSYASDIQSGGFLLGTTDTNGQITCTFTTGGTYVLAGIEEPYIPGLARINVRTPGQGKLQIKSPGSVDAGSSDTFTIVDKSTAMGIGSASLWALNIEDVKGTAESVWNGLAAGSAPGDVAEKYRGWAKDKGILLGTSADSGEVTYTFKDPGRYLLVAVKDDYAPGFSQIKVGLTAQKQLVVKAPQSAAIGQQIAIDVVENTSGQPVENATVYAYLGSRIRIHPAVQPTPKPNDNETVSSSAQIPGSDEAAGLMMQSAVQPITIGVTDGSGQVSFTFTSAGTYTLVAFKDGYARYLPGGAKINILSPESGKALAIDAAINPVPDQPSSIKVWDTSSGEPVSGAAVYVLRLNDVSIAKPGTFANNSVKKGNEADSARQQGSLAGYTDAGGQLLYSFGSSGQYLLAAFKDGYTAGFNYVTVTKGTTQDSFKIRPSGTPNRAQ